MDDTDRLMIEIAASDMTAPAFAAVNRALGETQSGLEKTRDAMKATNEAGEKAGVVADAVGEIGKIAAGVFAGISVDRAVTGMIEFHKATMEEVSGLGSLADRLGISTDQLQAYQAAARGVNVTNDELNKLVATFNINIGKARDGAKDQIDALNTLGVKILDQNGKLRANVDILSEVSRALVAVENPMQRAAIASSLVGDKGARLTPLLRELATNVDELTGRARENGEVVDRDVIDKLDKAGNAYKALQGEVRALYAAIAAPIQTQAMDSFTKLIRDFRSDVRGAQGDWQKFLDLQARREPLAAGGFRRATKEDRDYFELGEAQKRLADLNKQNASPLFRDAATQKVIDDGIASETKRIRELTDALTANAKAGELAGMQDRLLNDGLPAQDTTAGVGQPTARTGGGGEQRDRIQEALNKIVLERAAAEKALAAMTADKTTPLKDLERATDLNRKIQEEIASLGKYNPADPRVDQIKREVAARETALSAEAKYRQAMTDAVEIERKSGDGTAAYADQVQRLNDALATGRLSQAAYNAEMKNAGDQADLARLKLEGTAGGVEGLAAGFGYAAKQWQMQNTSFQVGGRLFERVTTDMSAAMTNWRKTGQFDMGEFLASWGDMLIQMEMQAAASSVWKSLGGMGGMGSGLADLFNFGGPSMTDLNQGAINNISVGAGLPGVPAFADGGRPSPGKVSLIGEEGPELWVPDAAGTIVPNDKLGGGAGGDTVFHQENHFHGGVTESDLARQIPKIAEASAALVADKVKRGGSYARTWK